MPSHSRHRILTLILALTSCLATIPAMGADRANSSDQRYAATILPIGKGDENGSGAQALDLTDRRTGRTRRLLISKWDGDFSRNLANLSDPLFSLSGGYLYFTSSDASPNSPAVHQIDLKTGSIRFVHAGVGLKVIRTGPWRGYLLVQVHRYYDRPSGGSYNPVLVVRPDGKQQLVVQGSENDDGELAIEPWLARKGWHAW